MADKVLSPATEREGIMEERFEKLVYTEAEAADLLGVKPRTLADYRRDGRLKGNYSVFGRNILYTPDDIRAIMRVFRAAKKAA